MNIRVLWCRKKATCHYCGEYILKHTPEVQGLIRKTYIIRFYWHLDCWAKEQEAYLAANPYVIKTRNHTGRPKISLTDEQREQRTLIRSRRGRAMQRIRKLIPKLPKSQEQIDRLQTYIGELKNQLEGLGGAPKNW